MSADHRHLLVLRHAKAEPFAASDHERTLTERGLADAAAAGRWAAARGHLPDHVVVSSAARTRGTWEAFAAAAAVEAAVEAEVVIDRSLYGAETDAALEILRTVPADARSVMLVGHNPTMAYLVHLLDDGGADPELFSRVGAGYPTAALAVLEVPGAWADLEIATARIIDFHVARG